MICNKCPMREHKTKKKNSECNSCLPDILHLIIPITWVLLVLSVLWILYLIIGVTFLKIIGVLIVVFLVLLIGSAMDYQ